MSENKIPRRIRVDLFTPAEKAIHDACYVVEEAGAHPLLTDAVVLLMQAREKVADYVDNTPSRIDIYEAGKLREIIKDLIAVMTLPKCLHVDENGVECTEIAMWRSRFGSYYRCDKHQSDRAKREFPHSAPIRKAREILSK